MGRAAGPAPKLIIWSLLGILEVERRRKCWLGAVDVKIN